MRAPLLILVVLLALAGCAGGEDDSVEESSAPEVQPRREKADAAPKPDAPGPEIIVAALGDSITAGNPAFDPDPKARAAIGFGDDEQSQYQYWAALSDDRLTFRNCGVFGERTDQIAARLDDCAKGADLLVIQGGINDIAQSLSGAPASRFAAVDAAAANIEEMVRRGKQKGLEVEITDVLPWNNGHPYATPLIQRLNDEIEQIGTQERVSVLPFHDVLDDPANPGLMAPDWTDDGDHPSIEGYRRLGELAFHLP